MKNYSFFRKKKSKKELAGAPSYSEWIESINENNNWQVINTQLLNIGIIKTDTKLNDRVNAFKLCLQTFGPSRAEKLPSFINNKGKAQNHIYHGHVTGSSGTTYVMEWTVIDAKQRIMALVGFDKHENYRFKKVPLTANEKQAILNDKVNVALMARAEKIMTKTKEKIARTIDNGPKLIKS